MSHEVKGKKPQSMKDKTKLVTQVPKPRNPVVQGLIEHGGSGGGKHHTRTKDVEKGRSRKPKHKKDFRDMAASVALRYASLTKD
jgi:hypothetical protein